MNQMAYTLQCPTPATDESYERYAIRAHKHLARLVPDPEDRNMLIEEVWRETRGPTAAEKMAADKLGEDFIRKPNVAYFTEHETLDNQGKPRKYDLRKLIKIVRNANNRIADVAAFPAIADGHTPAPGSGHPQPDVLGYVGNYRLGMLGRQKPRWAIFADEFHSKAHADRLAAKPRRSVELWTFKDSGKSHFDPIAALGSEAPRLPLPVAFQMLHEGQAEVEKYTVAAPAAPAASFPGGSNTAVKTHKKEPTKMALSDEDVAQIVGAISETPQWKFLDQAMMDAQADDVAAAQGDLEMTAEEEPGDEEIPEDVDIDVDVDLEDEPEGEDMPPEEPPAEEAPPAEMAEEVDEETADLEDLLAEDEEENFSMSATNNGDLAEKYSALMASHTRLVKSHGNLRKQMTKLAKERHDGHRKAVLMDLDRRFPGVIDLDEEYQACLYSAGSDMDAKAFKAHVGTVEKYAARVAPVGPMIPGGVVGQGDEETEKYEAGLVDAAVEICTAAASEGKPITYDEGVRIARERLAK